MRKILIGVTAVCAVMALMSLIGVLMGATWHLLTFVMFLGLTYVGVVSVNEESHEEGR